MSAYDRFLETMSGKHVTVIGIGVSNTPLIRMLLRADLDVTVCDRAQRERVEEQAEELESLGARLRLGEAYLEGLDQDVIFRTPGMKYTLPELEALLDEAENEYCAELSDDDLAQVSAAGEAKRIKRRGTDEDGAV